MNIISRLFVITLIILTSCNLGADRTKIDVSRIEVPQVRIHRYDVDLFKIDPAELKAGLKKIQPEYPFFLSADLENPSNLAQMKEYLLNPRNRDFQKATAAKYTGLSGIEKQMTDSFRHVRYYYPSFRIPRVYTYISGGDYENQVSLADSVLLISLDTYLGEKFEAYQSDGLPLYRTERMNADQIVPDCMRSIVNNVFPQDASNMTLLEQMTEAGKRLYLLQAFIPDAEGNILMKYPKEQYEWVKENEAHVWAAIIDNKMLYSTEGRTLRIFMADGPYTPEFSKASPPRLGEWIGLQIIRSYMQENPDIQVKDMLAEKDSQKILQHSGYKPKK